MLYGECPTNREQPQKKIATAAYPSIRRERRKYACVQRKRGKTRKRSVQHTAGKPTKAVRAFKSADGFRWFARRMLNGTLTRFAALALYAGIFAAFSSYTWISGGCYLLLWLLSICWAFPIKHKIRKLRKGK